MPSQLEPRELTDQGQSLLRLLGSFWSDFYGGSSVIEDLFRARQESCRQTLNDLRETVLAVDRTRVPIYHCERWYPLVLTQSEELEDERLTVEDDDVLDGDTALANRVYRYAVNASIKGFSFLQDQIVSPGLLWVEGIDYDYDPTTSTVSFRQDPFSAGFTIEPVYDEDNVISDRTVRLWLGQASIDREFIATQFGHILQLVFASSENYRNLVNAVWDADLIGTTRAHLDNALAALCDVPLALSDGEIVEQVVTDVTRTLVITDANVYIGTVDAGVLVAEGDVLREGDRIFDAFEVIELSQGTPDASVLPELTLPLSYLKGDFTDGLTFVNELVPLVVTVDDDRTRVEFSIDGDPDDVDLFWDMVHEAGTEPGARSLAQLLDQREDPPEESDPDETSLPDFINPLDFLVSNVLRYGLTLVRLTESSFGPNALGTEALPRILRILGAPQGHIMLIS